MSEVFHRTREALIRAAYRGLLHREPDAPAAAELSLKTFTREQEQELATVLGQFVESVEFRARRRDVLTPNYPLGTWARAEVDGLLLWVDLGDLGVSQPCVTGSFEPLETRYLRGLLQPGMTFVDVGANIGWFSLNAARLIGPEGRLFAFEPRQDTFAALSRSFEDNGYSDRATLINAAVGDAAGEILIGWAPEAANPGGTWTLANSELRESFANLGRTVQRTPVVVLDEVIGDGPVHVIKIDIEGAEPIALRGASRILRTQRPIILSELNPIVLAAVSRVSPVEFVNAVEAEGYTCHALAETGLGDRLDLSDPSLSQRVTNVIFKPIGA